MQAVQHPRDSSQDAHDPAQTSTRPINNAVQPASSQPQLDSDAALAADLSPWITCATMLAKVAASVAAQSCCQDLQYGIKQGTQHSSSEPPQQKALQDSQAKEALTKVMNGLDSTSEGGHQAPVLPALKRRNSGKRNLHKPWTATEEEQLVKLVDQPEYRKEVLNVHRLTVGAWAKFGRHLGRSGGSGVQAIKAKYRTLKQQTTPQPAAVLSSDILAAAAHQLASGAEARSPASEGTGGKRSKLTACTLAILGLQSLPSAEGTGKDIMAAIDTNPTLMPHLNWEADQNGKIRWRNGVLCSLSAEKSGIFVKTGRKQAGQIVWCLDSFKAQNELNRHAEVVLKSQGTAPTQLCMYSLEPAM